ncbi:hypothetical protein DQ04_00281200 [Trypanosoma grayi]|uniref:hypothetical protein n=1 Tax=Trypanosoma grayi TaxID=71804 RepID=UPI0004F480A3|nr:hypothetical protein DQ04_00281200 [Trypanosoma grayi]KEG14857.1 hypothetical protein DQ04_00281200 [Trypanosoma grayi]
MSLGDEVLEGITNPHDSILPTEGLGCASEGVQDTEVVAPSSAAGTGTSKMRSLAAGQVDRAVAAALPNGMHVSKDARIAFQKAATVFLMYLSCLADDERSGESKKRVTLCAQDIKGALKAAGMGHLVPLLSIGHMKRGRSDDHSLL